MSTYTIRLLNEAEQLDVTYVVPENEYILDVAQAQGRDPLLLSIWCLLHLRRQAAGECS